MIKGKSGGILLFIIIFFLVIAILNDRGIIDLNKKTTDEGLSSAQTTSINNNPDITTPNIVDEDVLIKNNLLKGDIYD